MGIKKAARSAKQKRAANERWDSIIVQGKGSCLFKIGQAEPLMQGQHPTCYQELFSGTADAVSLLELVQHEATPMHRHDRDMLAVFVDGGRTRTTVLGHKAVLALSKS